MDAAAETDREPVLTTVWRLATMLLRRPSITVGAAIPFWVAVTAGPDSIPDQGYRGLSVAVGEAVLLLSGPLWGLGASARGLRADDGAVTLAPPSRRAGPLRQFVPRPGSPRGAARVSVLVMAASWWGFPLVASWALTLPWYAWLRSRPDAEIYIFGWPNSVIFALVVTFMVGVPAMVGVFAVWSWGRALGAALAEPAVPRTVRVVGYEHQTRSWVIEATDETRYLVWLPWLHRHSPVTGDVLAVTGRLWDPVHDERRAQRAALALTGRFGTVWARGLACPPPPSAWSGAEVALPADRTDPGMLAG